MALQGKDWLRELDTTAVKRIIEEYWYQYGEDPLTLPAGALTIEQYIPLFLAVIVARHTVTVESKLDLMIELLNSMLVYLKRGAR